MDHLKSPPRHSLFQMPQSALCFLPGLLRHHLHEAEPAGIGRVLQQAIADDGWFLSAHVHLLQSCQIFFIDAMLFFAYFRAMTKRQAQKKYSTDAKSFRAHYENRRLSLREVQAATGIEKTQVWRFKIGLNVTAIHYIALSALAK